MREATTANKQQLANLTRKICEVDRSMKMKTENGAFIAENFVQKTKKKQVPACRLSIQNVTTHNRIFENQANIALRAQRVM